MGDFGVRMAGFGTEFAQSTEFCSKISPDTTGVRMVIRHLAFSRSICPDGEQAFGPFGPSWCPDGDLTSAGIIRGPKKSRECYDLLMRNF